MLSILNFLIKQSPSFDYCPFPHCSSRTLTLSAHLITIFFVFKVKTEDDTLSLRYYHYSYRTYANYLICATKRGLEGFKTLELQPFATEQRTENIKQQPIICTCLSRTAHTNYFIG